MSKCHDSWVPQIKEYEVQIIIKYITYINTYTAINNIELDIGNGPNKRTQNWVNLVRPDTSLNRTVLLSPPDVRIKQVSLYTTEPLRKSLSYFVDDKRQYFSYASIML